MRKKSIHQYCVHWCSVAHWHLIGWCSSDTRRTDSLSDKWYSGKVRARPLYCVRTWGWQRAHAVVSRHEAHLLSLCTLEAPGHCFVEACSGRWTCRQLFSPCPAIHSLPWFPHPWDTTACSTCSFFISSQGTITPALSSTPRHMFSLSSLHIVLQEEWGESSLSCTWSLQCLILCLLRDLCPAAQQLLRDGSGFWTLVTPPPPPLIVPSGSEEGSASCCSHFCVAFASPTQLLSASIISVLIPCIKFSVHTFLFSVLDPD